MLELDDSLVSIITPTYNSADFITSTIESVISQVYENWEMVITDDFSADDTCKIIDRYIKKDKRIRLFRMTENGGAGKARNNSLKNARGRYIAFLDSDDLWYEDKLVKQVDFMHRGGIPFSFTSFRMISVGKKGKSNSKIVDLQSPFIVGYIDMLAKRATIGCSTVMLDTSMIHDYLMEDVRTGQDYILWLKILRNGIIAHNMRECLVDYRLRKNSISRNKLRKALRQWYIYREIEKLGIGQSLKYFINYAYRAVVRR